MQASEGRGESCQCDLNHCRGIGHVLYSNLGKCGRIGWTNSDVGYLLASLL